MASDKPAELVEDFFGDISLEVSIILTVLLNVLHSRKLTWIHKMMFFFKVTPLKNGNCWYLY